MLGSQALVPSTSDLIATSGLGINTEKRDIVIILLKVI